MSVRNKLSPVGSPTLIYLCHLRLVFLFQCLIKSPRGFRLSAMFNSMLGVWRPIQSMFKPGGKTVPKYLVMVLYVPRIYGKASTNATNKEGNSRVDRFQDERLVKRTVQKPWLEKPLIQPHIEPLMKIVLYGRSYRFS